MKTNTTNNTAGTSNTAMQHNHTGKHQRPENKDDLDSRKNEEYDFKGDDMTHNKKNTKQHHLHKQSNDK
jgi:hypothetical protein